MKKKNYKGRCEKQFLTKCQGICRTYSPLQQLYATLLQADPQVKTFQCNVELEKSEFTTDFLITKTDGTIIVRECVVRNLIAKPRMLRHLDESLVYWKDRGIEDWKVITNAEE